ncbi:Elongator subunit elp6 [Mortierella sp. GBA35]|nr:Elongator subunit elp6 [Mortierella sp. AD031]KAF9087500.1 Elongator subunit elp6 [Mortierella sp. GBA35]KAG0207209.1 Elongator subunit elp6 [Mortierella sp. NVP41]
MGYASLEPHLPSSHAPLLPPGTFLSISDTQASDGNFLLHHFISNYIKADQNVVLVGLAGILVHYTMVGRKLGVNLATARTKGNFQFVDGLTQLTDYAAPNKEYLAKPAEPKPSPSPTATTITAAGSGRIARPAGAASAAAPPAPPKVLSYSPKLVDLYRALEEVIQNTASSKNKQLCLILDDLSVLLNCGWPCRDVLALVRYLKLLVAKFNGTLITLVHADGVMAEEVSQDGLVKGVFYEADYIIDVRGLDSGGSRDVHGQLSLLHGPGHLLRQRAGQVRENEWPALTLHYKILDNNVEVFAKGSVSESLDEIEFSRSIFAACTAHNVDRVESILCRTKRKGESPAISRDSAGYTALHYASRTGNKATCTLLLNAGADVDAKTPELGTTALMRAVQQNHLDIAKLLVSYGANIQERNTSLENVFHVLALAIKGASTPDAVESFQELATWLRTKAKMGHPGRLEGMLEALDVRGQRPVDYLDPTITAELREIFVPPPPPEQQS